MKFHENISNNFEDIERKRVYGVKICQAVLKLYSGHKNCLQTHTHKKENYVSHCMHTSYAGGITRVTIHVFCMSSHGLKFV